MRLLLALLPILGLAAPLAAQDKEKEKLKRDILKGVEEQLKKRDEALLKEVERVIDEELRKEGNVPAPPQEPKAPAAPPKKVRGYLGLRPSDLDAEEKKKLGLANGVKVEEAVADGPAAKAGLQAGDVIVTLDGRPIDSPQEIPVIVQAAGVGATIKIEYVRDGKKATANAVLAPHPQDVRPAEPPPGPGKGEEGDLRDRVKKLLEKKEKEEPPAEEPKAKPKMEPPPAEPPAEGEGDELFALDEAMLEQVRPMLKQFGVDPEQFFEKGADGKFRLNRNLQDLFKGFDFKSFDLEQFKEFMPKELMPKGEPEPAPAPRKPAPRKEPKPTGKPWLGLQPEELGEDLRSQLDLPAGAGLRVALVKAGSPAEKAGVLKHDILVKIDGKPVKGEDSLAAFMEGAKIGQEVVLTVLRKGKEQEVKVTLGERIE